jgi:hypothetical protein
MMTQPGPVVTSKGKEEQLIDKISDEQVRGKGNQYLVHWHGWGAEKDRWLAGRELEDMKALDIWLCG